MRSIGTWLRRSFPVFSVEAGRNNARMAGTMLLRAVHTPQKARAMTVTGLQTSNTAAFFTAGGTLPPDAPSYLERDADRELFVALRAGQLCYLLNARQMGKSSLCVRVMHRLQQQGIHTAFLDLTKFGGANVTPEQWY